MNGFQYAYLCTVHSLDARLGVHFKMSFTGFTTGASHSFGGEYRELVESQAIRYTDKFDDANLPDEMEVVVNIRSVSCGPELTITQNGISEVILLEMCYLS